MTNGSSDRLDQIEALLQETIQVTRSNSKTIQAILDLQANSAEERRELREATIGIANLLSSLDSDRPTILRKLTTIENKVDRLLSQGSDNQPEP